MVAGACGSFAACQGGRSITDPAAAIPGDIGAGVYVELYEPGGRATLGTVELLWDGKVVQRATSSPPAAAAALNVEIASPRGTHTVGVRVANQTASPARYNWLAFVVGADLRANSHQTIFIGSRTAPRSDLFTTNQAVTFTVTIDP